MSNTNTPFWYGVPLGPTIKAFNKSILLESTRTCMLESHSRGRLVDKEAISFVLIPRCLGYLWYSLLVLFLFMKYVYALYWDCHLFLADPWSITVLTEDVKGSFDSIEYQGTIFFDWKKEKKRNFYFFCNIYHPFFYCAHLYYQCSDDLLLT